MSEEKPKLQLVTSGGEAVVRAGTEMLQAAAEREVNPPPAREPALGLEPEQLMLRRTGIGGSEIGVLAGLSRWSTPIKIFQSKTLDANMEPTVSMELGNLLEEPMAGLYRRRTGLHTGKVATLRHPDARFRYAIATPDRGVFMRAAPEGEVRDQGPTPMLSLRQLEKAEHLLQLKSTSWRMAHEWGEPGSDEVPPDYMVAEVWAMGITGQRRSDFGVLFDKDRFETYTVFFDQLLFEDLYAIAERFMEEHVLPGVPPPPDASESYNDFLKRVFPRELGEKGKNAKLEQCPPELLETIRRYAMVRGAAKVLAAASKLYAARIKVVIGEAVGFSLPYGKVTWTKDRDTPGVDWFKACAEARQIASLMLMNFGELMPAEDREQIAAQLKDLEQRHANVRRHGPRALRLTIAKAFKAELEVPREPIDVLELKKETALPGGEFDDGGELGESEG